MGLLGQGLPAWRLDPYGLALDTLRSFPSKLVWILLLHNIPWPFILRTATQAAALSGHCHLAAFLRDLAESFRLQHIPDSSDDEFLSD